ncbi:MAG TPA: MDR family oxidoreductase [Usitatibacteraceae bacterium]|nr:MDR family oxidoreductase [Usitatibacteraceae bacterium]
MGTFKGIVLSKDESGFSVRVAELDESQLPADGEVTVAIEYSTINYKDGLALTNQSPVVRKWPMVAGIDGAGTVLASTDARWKPGDKVVLNGFGVGENHWGCLAQRARLKADWLVALPAGFTTRQAMAIGTAGYTAALAVLALERQGVVPAQGEILVTGAAGGVGSVAIALLAARGFRVVASTGRGDETDYLKSLGAGEVVDRSALSAAGKPLQKERWAGVVDSVGSHTLANALAQCRYNAVVAACGLAQGMDLPTSVAPFILRGVVLAGIDSVYASQVRRAAAWELLARELDRAKLESMTREIALAESLAAAGQILAGRVRGRLVVDVNR